MEVTFDMIRSSPEIRTYITQADASLTALGFTEHSFAHVGKCAHVAAQILTELGYTPCPLTQRCARSWTILRSSCSGCCCAAVLRNSWV